MKNPPLAIALKLAQTLFFSLMYASIKLAGPAPLGEVVFFRGFFALVPLLAWTFYTVGPRAAIKTQRPLYHVVRGTVGVAAMFLNFAALALLPLATVTAFSFMQPIFAVILAALFLKEIVGPWRWGAVAAGFIGVLMMIEPHGGLMAVLQLQLSAGVVYALLFSFLSAVVVVWIRQMSTTERSEAIVFYFMSACAVIGIITMAFQHNVFTFHTCLWLVLCGLFGGVGQTLMTYSYRYGEPSLLAPFDYVSMVWAMILGWFLFGEMPENLVLWGAGVVIVSGLFIAWREHRHRIEVPRETVS
ncbi:drug/metabolite transporter (DMT)-like permease [Rhizomicrobium palustre]|uniref:Drug/metabolite transporter (DMT)-like permease n=1 Tax=Rhizomicrobium palustre TaxID=189966 RepID=A0A846MVR2_9PROT|nr:DMT family transporter [Rhizomicrobium palustre]NIK87251.1 drug/metabolite transporter (DMT)-like permease [Rhizomicrobium palustre]